ncbi:hypothetical protein [Geodermatophilus sp. SYSU D00710]
MTDDRLDALRARVAQQTGAARTRLLMELGQELCHRYWQIGPGSPRAEPYLDEAVTVLDEAHGHLQAGQFPRPMAAGMLGWLLGVRHVVHGGSDDDRERGIERLDEALSFISLPPMLQLTFRIVLGQLLVSRVTAGMRSGDFAMRAMRSGLSAEERASGDRAVACCRQVINSPVANAEIRSLAKTMLGLAEAVQNMADGLDGGLTAGGLDFGRMMQALAGLQALQQKAAAAPPAAGFTRMPNPFDFLAADRTSAPAERPITVVEGEVQPIKPDERPRPSARTPEPAAVFRDPLLGKLPGGLAGLPGLLADGAVLLHVDVVDELVALGSALVEAPDRVGTDHLLFAVTLYLRSVVDDGGWGDEGESDDVRSASESLLAAAPAVAIESADIVAVAFRLATLLDARAPARDVRARFGAAFADVAGALRTVGADGLLYQTAGQTLLLCAETGALTATGPQLPDRILVVGDGPAPAASSYSLVRSGGQLLALANRTRRPLAAEAVFVANPRGDRRQASLDALLLRRSFYPRSTGLGDTGENVDGAGTRDEVRARLDASLLHLGCGVTVDGGLELAGGDELGATEIAAGPPAATGGLAVLPPTPTGAEALTEALLAARFADVVRFRDAVPADVASIVQLALHAELVDGWCSPATAVARVRSWLADPRRPVPGYLPPWLEMRAGDPDLADPAYHDALLHHGL